MHEDDTFNSELLDVMDSRLGAFRSVQPEEKRVDYVHLGFIKLLTQVVIPEPTDIDETRALADENSIWGRAVRGVNDLCQEMKASDPSQLLRQAALASDLAHQLECQQVEAAYAWVLLNPPLPPEEIVTGAEDTPMTAGGPGAPVYRGGASDIFAVATGKSVRFSDNHMRRAGELIGRFPLTWQQIKQHHIPLWRAWALVRKTVELPYEVATFLDAELAPRMREVSPAQLDRAITASWAAVAPGDMAQVANENLDNRGVWVDRRNTVAGTCRIYGEMDAPDALSFDEFLSNAAKKLIENGVCERMPQARALALGMLSRGEIQATPISSTDGVVTIPPVDVQLYVHFSREQIRHHTEILSAHADSLTPAAVGSGVASVEGLDTPVLLAQIQQWCSKDFAAVRVTQVIDLEDSYMTDSYRPSNRIREQVMIRDWTCVFPSCTRRARACDIDHVIAHSQGGCTCSENLAALCRRHHRAKTRNQWDYSSNGDDYLWECLRTYMSSKYLKKRKERPTWWIPPKDPPDLNNARRRAVMELRATPDSEPPF